MSSSTENDGTAEASAPAGNGNSFRYPDVCVRKNNNGKKDFKLSMKELCSFVVELLISYTADCVNAFTPLKDTKLQLGRRM
jgi:hypothetical protein